MKILTSASKITLLFFSFILGVGVLWRPDIFFKLFDYVMVALVSFYFGQKVNVPLEDNK